MIPKNKSAPAASIRLTPHPFQGIRLRNLGLRFGRGFEVGVWDLGLGAWGPGFGV